MFSLRLGERHPPPARLCSWESTAIAIALTAASMSGVALAWHAPVATFEADATRDHRPWREAIVPLVLPAPRFLRSPAMAPPVRAAPRSSLRSARQVDTPAPPRDTGGEAVTVAPRATVASPHELSPMAPVSTRLGPMRPGGTPWDAARPAHDPFAHGEQASPAERDSILVAMARQFAELAARRIPTRAERDARAKEAMLKMRLSGRTLLVPPDNTGGTITASIPIPWLGGLPSRRGARERAAESQRVDRAIQDRLRQRADSMRQARMDSAAKALPAP